MVEWFRRKSEKIKTRYKKEITEGSWLKCSNCNEVLYRAMLEENFHICTNCSYHFRIGAQDYINLLLEKNSFIELASNIKSSDPLNFIANNIL